MTFQFIADHAQQWPVTTMCRTLEVIRQWLVCLASSSAKSARPAGSALRQQIRAIHQQSRKTYGGPRIHAELQACGVRCSRKRVGRVMREQGVSQQPKRRTIRTTDSHHSNPVAPNLLNQEFTAREPNTKWATDVRHVGTYEIPE